MLQTPLQRRDLPEVSIIFVIFFFFFFFFFFFWKKLCLMKNANETALNYYGFFFFQYSFFFCTHFPSKASMTPSTICIWNQNIHHDSQVELHHQHHQQGLMFLDVHPSLHLHLLKMELGFGNDKTRTGHFLVPLLLPRLALTTTNRRTIV